MKPTTFYARLLRQLFGTVGTAANVVVKNAVNTFTAGPQVMDAGVTLTEQAAPAGGAGKTVLFSDSTSHKLTAKQAGNTATAVLLSGAVVDADISGTAAIASSKLADTPTASNVAGDIVLRDGSGNFAAGTITAALTGDVTGNVTGNVSGSSGSCTGNAATATDATNAANTGITDDTTTNATMYPTWVTANTGNLPQKATSTKLSFNPSTGLLTSTSFGMPNGDSTITGATGSDPHISLTVPNGRMMSFASASSECMRLECSANSAATAYTNRLGAAGQLAWTATTPSAAADTGLAREAAGVVAATNGSTGAGTFAQRAAYLTAATMTEAAKGRLNVAWHKYTWTAAMVVSGRIAADTSNVKICTLPAKTIVKRVYVITAAAATGVDSPTVSVGRTGAAYIDYIVATAPGVNTVIGNALAEIGTNLKDAGPITPVEDFAVFADTTSTTDIYAQFTCDGDPDINQWAEGTGSVYLLTETLP